MNLKELGLSQNESAIYEAILRFGKLSASQISKESGVNTGRLYDILGSLENKNLIRVIPEKTKKFVPCEPTSLKKMLKEKRTELERLDDEITKLQNMYDNNEKEAVEIVKGKRNFNSVLRSLSEAKDYQYSIKYNFDKTPEIFRKVKTLLRKKVDYKVIGRIDDETKRVVSEWKKTVKEIKPIKNNGVIMSIADDKELMICMIKSNTTMVIRDRSTIEIMKQLFEAYYDKN